MANELTGLDLAKINEAIRAKVKLSFLEAIPEDIWKAMIDKEIKLFMEPQRSYGYNNDFRPSDFSQVVNTELSNELRSRMVKIFNSPEWMGKWEPGTDGMGHEEMSAAVKKIMVEKSQEIMMSLLGNAFQNVIQQMRSRM